MSAIINSRPKWVPGEEDRKVLESLRDEAAKEKSHAAFAFSYIGISADRFCKVLAALDENPARRSYFDEVVNPEEVMADLRARHAKLMHRRRREEFAIPQEEQLQALQKILDWFFQKGVGVNVKPARNRHKIVLSHVVQPK